jgi:protein SCO1/2
VTSTPPRALLGALTGVALLAAVFAIVGLSHRDENGAGPAALADTAHSPFAGATMPKGVRAPDFELTDENGRRVTMAEYRGRPVVVTYLYTHCKDTCPITAQMIRGAFDDLGRDVPALAVTVDPFRDTALSARTFLMKQHVLGRIRFVLGTRRQLQPVWRGFAIQPQLPESEHQSIITLVDRRGFQRVADPVSNTNPEQLAHDIRVLLRERS